MRLLGALVAGRVLASVAMVALLSGIAVGAYHAFPIAHEFFDTLGHAAHVLLGYANRLLKGLSQ